MIPRTLFSADHELFRGSVQKFLEQHAVPFHAQWEKDGHVDRALWNKAGNMGFLCPQVPEEYGGLALDFGASIGIASGTLIECTSSELFRRADIAMYHAKMSGKGRITHYDAELNSVRERKLAIENQIRSGLERDEFEVWYQPIVDARSQTMSSVEALVRWPRRPEGSPR